MSAGAESGAADGVGLIEALTRDTGLVLAAGLALLLALYFVLNRSVRGRKASVFLRQTIMIAATVAVLVVAAFTLRDPLRDQVLKFLGILFSAAIAFSSTSLIGNGMAGLLLRAQGHFHGGDWVRVGDHFGQAVHRGLFFTTIQDEYKDLVTVPNSLMTTQPVTVFSEPTIISAEVSLGYDVPRQDIERLLLEAAEAAELEKPFVLVRELGDFAVTYRVSGLLIKTHDLLTRRSRLNCRVLDALHGGGVEIVSPAFMNQRRLADGQRFVPPPPTGPPETETSGPEPEAEIFDRGREARSLKQLEDAAGTVEEKLKELRAALKEAGSDEARAELERQIESAEQGRQKLADEIAAKREEAEG